MTVIDSLAFAQTGQRLQGRLPISGLTRLRDGLADALGEVEFVVTGGRDARRRPILSVDVSGVLHLQCQRCLGALEFSLRLSNRLVLVDAGGAGSADLDSEESEWIEASAALDLGQLIEDEILLSLPLAPRHDEGACRQAVRGGGAESGNPAFAGLAGLKRYGK